jgi:multiple sugar transport system permease protein
MTIYGQPWTAQTHRAPRRRKTKKRPVVVAGTTLFLTIVAAFFLFPIWWLIVAATKSRANLSATSGLWFAHPSDLIRNVHDAFTRDGGTLARWLLNSALYAGVGAAFATLFASMAGYALAKYVFPGREATFNFVLAGVLVPATTLALPLFLLFSRAHAVDSYWSVLLPSMVTPLGVYLARVYASASVPNELLEAARMDGSSELRIFATISLRLMGPGLVTIFLFQFVTIWNNFFLPLQMLQDQKLYPVTLGLYAWNGQITQAPELQSIVIIGALVSTVPLMIAFLGLQRFWRGGLAAVT